MATFAGSRVVKALAYVTRGGQVLLLTQPSVQGAGVQLPGGSVEPGESLVAAALREVREETGLGSLSVASYLGAADYDLKVDVGRGHQRHFFHLLCTHETPARWSHPGGKTPSGETIMFELSWCTIRDAHLDWEMDAYLAVVSARLRCST